MEDKNLQIEESGLQWVIVKEHSDRLLQIKDLPKILVIKFICRKWQWRV